MDRRSGIQYSGQCLEIYEREQYGKNPCEAFTKFFVCVEIEDEGPGVILDEVPRCLIDFTGVPQMKDREGVGIGIVSADRGKFCKKQKGYIKVKNGEKGSLFSDLSSSVNDHLSGESFKTVRFEKG